MMRLSLLLFLFAIPTALYAAPAAVLIKAKVYRGGEMISSPQILSLLGEKASISQGTEGKDYFEIEVLATEAKMEAGQTAIQMDMNISYRDQQESYQAKPSVISLPGEMAVIEIAPEHSDGSNIRLELEASFHDGKSSLHK